MKIVRCLHPFLPFLWRPGKLARDTMVLSTGLGLRALGQALVFIIVARVLGSQGYGAFSATLAVAGVWVNFSGLGGHVLLTRDVARNPASFPQSWAMTLTVLGFGTIIVFVMYLISVEWFLAKIPLSLIVTLGLGELLFWPFANAAAYAYQGFERMGRFARLMLTPVVSRLVAALLLFGAMLHRPETDSLVLWGGLYAGASLLAAIYALHRVWSDLGRPVWPGWARLKQHVQSGWPFSFWGSAQKVYADADKFLLARLSTLETTGLYSAGYRFVDLAFLPVYSLLGASAPRLFRAGVEGRRSALDAAIRLAGPSLFYCLAVGVVLLSLAPLIPLVLGEQFLGTVAVVSWLAWLPLASLPRLLLSQVLAASDAQHLGMAVLLAGATANVGLNLWWIPVWGWRGAVLTTYAAELAMILILLGIIAWRLWN